MVKDRLIKMSAKSTIQSLRNDELSNLLLYVPPIFVQRQIIDIIEPIEKLRETLISSVNKNLQLCKKLLKLIIINKSFTTMRNLKDVDFIKSGINDFVNNKEYIDTSCIDGVQQVKEGINITLLDRPSRANMQPIVNSV
jgi:hypothetical protein